MKKRTEVLTAVSTADLHQRIYRLYDHLYANAPVRTPAGIGREVGKILHTAMYAEQNRKHMFNEFGFSPAFQFSNSDVKRLVCYDELLSNEIVKVVRHEFHQMNERWDFYPSEEGINLSNADIAFACVQLNYILISDKNRDVFGDTLEVFRGQWAKRESGQFFTDQRVTSLAMVLLQFDPRKGDDLVDLCAGTGGFLLAGLNRIRELLEETNDQDVERNLIELATKAIKGQEIDVAVADIANATLSVRLSRLHKPFVTTGDSLRVETFSGASQIHFNSHLCAATNPPFGSKITIKERAVLNRFELAVAGNRTSARSPDTLFIEQNVRILKPGDGRLAIVVPYQILSGPQALYIREWIIRHTEILAVVDLPPETFQPHTGTKGALLVLKRRPEPIQNDHALPDNAIFIATPRWIGHDRRGNPVYEKNNDGSFSGEILSDFKEVELAYEYYLKGGNPSEIHAKSNRIRLRDVLDDPEKRLNASFHTPRKLAFSTSRINTTSSPESWKHIPLRDVVKKIFYPGRFKRNYVDYYPGAVPFLGGSNISQLTVITDKWLRHDDVRLENFRVQTGWILITRSGSTGIVSSVPYSWDGYAMSEHIIRIIPNPEKLDPGYLEAFLRTDYAQQELAKGIFGSVIDEITPEHIGSIIIPIPENLEMITEVTKKMKRAQSAREEAIASLTDSVEAMNLLLMDSH